MKTILCGIFIATLITCEARSQDFAHCSLLIKKKEFNSGLLTSTQKINLSNIYYYRSDSNQGHGEAYLHTRKYWDQRRLRKVGIIETSIGAPFVAGGAPLLAIGIINVKNDIGSWNNANTPTIPHILELLFGTFLTGAGLDNVIQGPIRLSRANRQIQKLKESSE